MSNFEPEHLDQLESHTDVVPAINQVELHPYLQRWRELDAGRAHGIAIEADFEWPNGGRSIYVRDPAGNSVELADPAIWAEG